MREVDIDMNSEKRVRMFIRTWITLLKILGGVLNKMSGLRD